MSSLAANKALVRRFTEEVVNQRKPEAIRELVHSDYVEHEPLPGQMPGREGLLDWFVTYLNGFPDLEWELADQIAEGDRVVSRVLSRGTHKGSFLGIAPTGHRVHVAILLVHRLDDGQIVEGHTFPDSLAALRQLGQITTSQRLD